MKDLLTVYIVSNRLTDCKFTKLPGDILERVSTFFIRLYSLGIAKFAMCNILQSELMLFGSVSLSNYSVASFMLSFMFILNNSMNF